MRIAARRPDSPLLAKIPKRKIAASAVPRRNRDGAEPAGEQEVALGESTGKPAAPEPVRRTARIVQVSGATADERERERLKLLGRLLQSQGRGAISRAANEFLKEGFDLPNEQEVHLQLLEHVDETRARESLEAILQLVREQPPIKRPLLDQRLRRLEEHAEELVTRELAADLRRVIRA